MTFYKLPKTLYSDIDSLEQLVSDYKNKKIPKAKLKAYRVPMGIYEQRKDGEYMVRVRLPGGGGGNTVRNFQAIQNVPGSVKEEGHLVLEQKKVGDHWSVIIEKG